MFSHGPKFSRILPLSSPDCGGPGRRGSIRSFLYGQAKMQVVLIDIVQEGVEIDMFRYDTVIYDHTLSRKAQWVCPTHRYKEILEYCTVNMR